MIKKMMLSLVVLFALPLSAQATPVSISVEPWRTLDGNFGFSVIHSATAGLMQRGGMDLYAGGSIQYGFAGPTQFMMGDLTGDVLSLEASSLALDGGSIFNVQNSELDFGVANGELIGSLGYELVDSGGSVETGSFYFYNFDLTSGRCDANGFCSNSGEYRLWGNNWENAVADSQKGNVVIDGLRDTRLRGIDLGGNVASAPVPEPSAALLFGFGSLVACRGLRRRV